METLLLAAAINDRKFYDETKSYLEVATDFGPIAGELYARIQGYYEKDTEAKSIPTAFLKDSIRATVGKPKLAGTLCGFIDALPSAPSSNNVFDLLSSTKRSAIGLRLATALANKEGHETVKALIDDYAKWADFDPNVHSDDTTVVDFNRTSVRDLVSNSFAKEKLIKLWPKALNDRIDGGVRPGHHIVIFAHTEVGKTLVAINMVAGFLHQGLRVLYCGNEDPVSDIAMRSIVRLTQRNKFEVQADPDTAHTTAMEKGLGLLRLADLSPGSFPQISRLVDEYNPAVVILDQLRNIAVKRDGTRADSLEHLAIQARNLGKKKKVLVVSLTQAGISAENKLVLDISDMDSSKTGIPGQADLIIGIGTNQTTRANGLRVLNLSKNKLSGKHEYFEVEVNEQLGVVKSI